MKTQSGSFFETASSLLSRIPRIPYRNDRLFGVLFMLFLILPLIFVPGMGEAFETPKMFFYLVMMGVITMLLARRNQAFLKLPKVLLVFGGLFALTIILSTVFSWDVRNSLLGLVGRPSNSAIFLLAWLVLAYALFVNFSREKFLTLLKVVTFTGLLVGVYSILQHSGVGFYVGLNSDVRQFIPGFLGNPNFNSMYLAMIIPVSLYQLMSSNKFHGKAIYLAITLVTIWATAQTASRAAVLGLIAALVIQLGIAVYQKRSLVKVSWIIGAVVVSVMLSYLALNAYRPDNINQSLQFTDTTQNSRLVVWGITADMILEKPLLGTGLSNYFMDFSRYAWPTFSFGERFDDPHNIALILAANGGIPMLLTFLGLMFSVFYIARKQILDNPLATALAAGAIAWWIAGLFGPVVIACWVLLALHLAGLVALSVERIEWPKSGYWLPLGLVFGVILIVLGTITLTSNVFAEVAESYYGKQDYQKSYTWGKIALMDGWANTDANDYIVRSMIEMGRPSEETERVLLANMARKPNSSKTYAEAATIYYKLWHQSKDPAYLTKMNQAMDEAIRYEPNFAGLYAKLAYLSFKAGDIDRAMWYQKLSLTSHSDEFYGWVLLSKLYYEKGQREQFLNSYERAFKNSSDTFLIKSTLEDFRNAADFKSIPFPVYFPEPQ